MNEEIFLKAVNKYRRWCRSNGLKSQQVRRDLSTILEEVVILRSKRGALMKYRYTVGSDCRVRLWSLPVDENARPRYLVGLLALGELSDVGIFDAKDENGACLRAARAWNLDCSATDKMRAQAVNDLPDGWSWFGNAPQ